MASCSEHHQGALAIQGFGQKSLEEVRARLAERGWALRGDAFEEPRTTTERPVGRRAVRARRRRSSEAE